MNQYLIRTRDEGGIFGDPYQELTVSNNTFTTSAYGGSAWRWNENYTFEYKNGEWYLLSRQHEFGYGDFQTSYQYDNYKTGIGLRRETEESPNKREPITLEYNVRLDKQQPLLIDFTDTLYLSEDRIHAPKIDSIQYIGVYSYKNKNLQIIERTKTSKKHFEYEAIIYKGRLYYVEYVSESVSVHRDGLVFEERDVVAVQLISIMLDGTDKKIVFIANHPEYQKNKVIELGLSYLSLNFEIKGDEIYVEVYSGDNHPYYKMDLDGEVQNLIGIVPRGEW